jgi:hypothetical protein
MLQVSAIRTAVYAYEDGTYEFPMEYSIIAGISPTRIPPLAPEDILPWLIPQNHFSSANILLRRARRHYWSSDPQVPTTPTRNPPGFDFNISFSSLEIGTNNGIQRRAFGSTSAQGNGTPTTPSTRRNRTYMPQASTQRHMPATAPTLSPALAPTQNTTPSSPAPAYTPLPRPSTPNQPSTPPSQNQPSLLSYHMIQYLSVHHLLTAHEIHRLEELALNASVRDLQQGNNSFISGLRGHGLSRAEAIFFRNWVFDQQN